MTDLEREALAARVEAYLESESLGFDIGTGQEVIDFLARLEMSVIETLVPAGFSVTDREMLFNWVEERKGELPDEALPPSESQRRAVTRKGMRRTGRGRSG